MSETIDTALGFLHVVQAAVSAGAHEMNFVVGTNDICVYICVRESVPEFSVEFLLMVLENEAVPETAPGQYVKLAFTTWIKSCQQPWFRWASIVGDSVTTLERRQGAFEITSEDSGRGLSDIVYRLGVCHSEQIDGVGFGHRVYDLVASRCAFAPLTFSGTSFKPGHATVARGSKWHSRLSAPYLLAEFLIPKTTGAMDVRLPPKKHYRQTEGVYRRTGLLEPKSRGLFLGFGDSFEYLDQEFVRCDKYASLPLAVEGVDQVFFIKDGVLQEAIVLDTEGSGMQFYACAGDLECDNRFRVTKTDGLADRLLGILDWRAACWENTLAHLRAVPKVADLSELPEEIEKVLRLAAWPFQLPTQLGLLKENRLGRDVRRRLERLLGNLNDKPKLDR